MVDFFDTLITCNYVQYIKILALELNIISLAVYPDSRDSDLTNAANMPPICRQCAANVPPIYCRYKIEIP